MIDKIISIINKSILSIIIIAMISVWGFMLLAFIAIIINLFGVNNG